MVSSKRFCELSEAHSRSAHFATHVHFAVCASGDVHIAGGVGEFQADGAGHGVVAVKVAADRGPDVASGAGKQRRSQDAR